MEQTITRHGISIVAGPLKGARMTQQATTSATASRNSHGRPPGRLTPLLIMAALSVISACQSQEAGPETPIISEEALHEHIRILSSDDFQGRAPGTEGGQNTVAYLTRELEGLLLSPGNQGRYTQTVPMVETTLTQQPRLDIRLDQAAEEKSLEYGQDMMAWSPRQEETVRLEDSDLIFVGYGIVAPEYDWNDYEDMDVTGKTVVMLVNDPGFATGDEALFDGNTMTYYGRWTYKFEEAARQGAEGALLIHEDDAAGYGWSVVSGSWSGPQLYLAQEDDQPTLKMEGWISQGSAESLFNAQGLDLDTMKAASLEPEFAGHSLDGWASIELNNRFQHSESENVIAYLPGEKRPEETIIYTAHWDHLGVDPDDEDVIYNGAVDNASGSAAVLELARAFSEMEQAPDRSIVFLWVTAEEQGLLGSRYYAENPVFPLESTVAGINLDSMNFYGPTRDVTVVGYGNSELDQWLAATAEEQDRHLRPEPHPERGYFFRSDHFNLARKGVPVLYPNPGIDHVEGGEEYGRARQADYQENRYHQPADEYDPDWDLSGLAQDTRLLWRVGYELANSETFPNWAEDNEFRRIRDESRRNADGS
ncbi:Zn-dependent M28 family amino/carboxypeptidase [Natronospira proteinivora]|uniref:Zn-dependent M28 family amino/carboxypeptidase n=1 Tax=Natronospira proteinivora TaxID=1807133 RepID=A0ABT1GAV1_9GAMM|nr:M28 family metallopeptidase [Natronospira proteinivora]MCP1728456.1 Zn-dependent M28 family amino/carboxypeptidase [Natronospira proteinivora]